MVALFFTVIRFATAQAPTGSFAGLLRDRSGGFVSAAGVKAVWTASGTARMTASSTRADFSFPALQPARMR